MALLFPFAYFVRGRRYACSRAVAFVVIEVFTHEFLGFPLGFLSPNRDTRMFIICITVCIFKCITLCSVDRALEDVRNSFKRQRVPTLTYGWSCTSIRDIKGLWTRSGTSKYFYYKTWFLVKTLQISFTSSWVMEEGISEINFVDRLLQALEGMWFDSGTSLWRQSIYDWFSMRRMLQRMLRLYTYLPNKIMETLLYEFTSVQYIAYLGA